MFESVDSSIVKYKGDETDDVALKSEMLSVRKSASPSSVGVKDT
jgi:hypothetical protein